MVLSQLVARSDYGLGMARVVACKHSVSSTGGLLEEARALWAAESKHGKPKTDLCAPWGAVGVLFRNADGALRDDWTKLIGGEECTLLDCSKTEDPIINPDGTLAIAWPSSGDGADLASFDMLLATATEPTLKERRYPRPSEIAQAWVDDEAGHESYFFKNVERGIRTFRDNAIWRHLSRSKKAKTYRGQYLKAIEALEAAPRA